MNCKIKGYKKNGFKGYFLENGSKFANWTVINMSETSSANGDRNWFCRCVCGKE